MATSIQDQDGNVLQVNNDGSINVNGVPSGTHDGQTGVSGTVNVPTGARVIGYTATGGTGAATADVPDIGVVIIPANFALVGSPEETIVGPATFVFMSTVTYVVEWVV